jgi:hypothetical protein
MELETISEINNIVNRLNVGQLNDLLSLLKSNEKYNIEKLFRTENILYNGINYKTIFGFKDWEELEIEKKKLISEGYKVDIVEIVKLGYLYSVITDNIPTEEYDIEKMIEDICGDTDYKLFNFDDEFDSLKQSIEYFLDEKNFKDISELALSFAKIYEIYENLKEYELLIYDNFVSYKVLPKKSMGYFKLNNEEQAFYIGLKINK